MEPLKRYITEMPGIDHLAGALSRRQALRRLPLMGLGASAAAGLIGACDDRRAVPPGSTNMGFGAASDGQEASVSGGRLVARNPLYIDPTQAPYHVKMDRYTATSASMSARSNPTHLAVSGYTFTSDDVGKVVKVAGAGSAGASLKTTIIGAGGRYAVLGSPCRTSVSDAFCIFGTDNATALRTLFDDLSYTGRGRKLSRAAVFPQGAAMYSGTLQFPIRGTVKGVAENWSLDFMYQRFGGAENMGTTTFYQMWDQNADCATVQHSDHMWYGVLHGFAIIQDWENTAGHGLNFTASDGTGIKLIDGAVINRVAAMGCANTGFNFNGGGTAATILKELWAFCNGYTDRKLFTADSTKGSATLTNVSSTSGLAVGGMVSGPSIPVDSVIASVDSSAGTVTTNRSATATASSISVQRAGSAGIRFRLAAGMTVHFDSCAGDMNSGGLLRLAGPGDSAYGSGILITNMKSEFAENVYINGYAGPGTGLRPVDFPQQANAIVLDNLTISSVSIRGLVNWGTMTSGVDSYDPPNTYGRDLGAAILNLNTGAAPTVSWESLRVHLPTGATQDRVAYRDSLSPATPIPADASGRGTNRPPSKDIRSIADSDVTASVQDSVLVWSSISAPRTFSLPAISTVPAGGEYLLIDGSGSASPANTVTVRPAGSDAILGNSILRTAYGRLSLINDGTAWVGSSNEVAGKVAVPETATAPGLPGEWAAVSSYLYICVSPNTWMRAAVASW